MRRAGIFRLLNFLAGLGGLFEFLLRLRGLVGKFVDGFVAFFRAHGPLLSVVDVVTVGAYPSWAELNQQDLDPTLF
jgi:hypothetical protein